MFGQRPSTEIRIGNYVIGLVMNNVFRAAGLLK